MDADTSPHILPAAYISAGVPPVGGVLRERPEDFIVEELPAYQPSGQGEHIYLFVQKYNMAGSELVSVLARHFGVRECDVGYAGLKDRRAVTRQVVSIHAPGRKPEDFPSIGHERLQVLWADLHTNKLRRGHLKGNRFAIKIRRAPLGGVLHARRVLERLAQTGVPNRAGEQRFGALGNNHLVGAHVLRGDYAGAIAEMLRPFPFDPSAGGFEPTGDGGVLNDAHQAEARRLWAAGDVKAAARLMPRYAKAEHAVLNALARGADPERAFGAVPAVQRSFYLSAFQSAVFNAVLDERLAAGTVGALVEGDVAFKHDSGAAFVVDAPVDGAPDTAQRLAALELSPSGPMWAAGMLRAGGQTARAERAALERAGLSEELLARYDQQTADRGGEGRGRDHLDGARRPLRVPLSYPDVEAGGDEHGPYIRCSFELPAGAFATVAMREVMKPEAPDAPILQPVQRTPAGPPAQPGRL